MTTAPSTQPGPVAIRALSVADAGEYRAFRLRALQHAPAAFTSSFAEENAKPLSATIQRLAAAGRPHDTVIGAQDEARNLVGIAGLTVPARRQERHKATLFGMAVAPSATGQGIGKALVQRILDLAAGVGGLVQVGLTVSEGNQPAGRLYHSCGFRVSGREPRAVIVDGHPVAKLHMVRMLDESDRR